jgi:hypothetical protein
MTDEVLRVVQRVCAGCPVIRECAAYACEVEATWGMWAGQWRTPQTLAASRRAAA